MLVFSSESWAQYEHKDVVDNARNEALLPPHLKNPHYRIPRIREALAYYSWWGFEKGILMRIRYKTILFFSGLDQERNLCFDALLTISPEKRSIWFWVMQDWFREIVNISVFQIKTFQVTWLLNVNIVKSVLFIKFLSK